jgi:hypothetical protein
MLPAADADPVCLHGVEGIAAGHMGAEPALGLRLGLRGCDKRVPARRAGVEQVSHGVAPSPEPVGFGPCILPRRGWRVEGGRWWRTLITPFHG